MSTGNWIYVVPGDEVAILPHSDAPASKVIEIQRVTSAGPVLIQLMKGQRYHRIGGKSIDGDTFIVPVTKEHRAALKRDRK